MAKFEKSHIVCECNQVSLGEIAYAIEQKDAKTVKDIKNITDAGVTCGCCISKEKDVNAEKSVLYIKQILEKFNSGNN